MSFEISKETVRNNPVQKLTPLASTLKGFKCQSLPKNLLVLLGACNSVPVGKGYIKLDRDSVLLHSHYH